MTYGRTEQRTHAVPVSRVLIADDDPLFRVLAQGLILRGLPGCEVRSVPSGQECLRVHQAFRPDVVFLDIMMGRMNGLVTAHFLRHQIPSTRLYFLSGCHDPSVLALARSTPSDGYITKEDFMHMLKYDGSLADLMERYHWSAEQPHFRGSQRGR